MLGAAGVRFENVPRGGHEVLSIRFFSVPSGQQDDKKGGGGDSKTLVKVSSDDKKMVVSSNPPKAVMFLKGIAVGTWNVVRDPKKTWEVIKKEAKHYYLGSKLLIKEVKIASAIIQRVLEGHGMTRRERMQLVRTATDVFRVLPLSVFVLVPFMELALPFALRLFPNMLPSTFQEKYQIEEKMKSELQMRLAVAGFFQETLREMAKKKRKDADDDESGAMEIATFIEKARLGEPMANDNVLKIATHFKDELTLANIHRPQLVPMCQYMGLQPYGADAFLRFQLRTKLRALKEDDRRILWEGIETLTINELKDACMERGMRGSELSEIEYKHQLQEWLDLSIQKNIPISLLIMSRAFMLTTANQGMGPAGSTKTEDVLKSSMASLDSDIINEVVLASSKSAEELTIEMQERKLESLQFQQDMIEEEREDADEARLHKLSSLSQGDAAAATSDNNSSSSSYSSSNIDAESAAERGAAAPGAVGELLRQSGGDVNVYGLVDSTESAEKIASIIVRGDLSKEEVEEEVQGLTIQEMQALADLARGSSIEREKAELAAIEAGVEAAITAAMAAKKKEKEKKQQQQQQLAAKEGGGEEALHEGEVDRHHAQAQAAVEVAGAAAGAEEARAGLGADEEGVAEGKGQEEDEEEEDKSMAAMQNALNKMMDGIKGRIDLAEREMEASDNAFPMLDLDGDGELSAEEIKEAMRTLFKRTPTDEEVELLLGFLDKNQDGKVSVAELNEYVDERRRKFEVEVLEADISSSSNNSSSSSSTGVTITPSSSSSSSS
jgi:LETM1 and EF-hand domain-containing protein 1